MWDLVSEAAAEGSTEAIIGEFYDRARRARRSDMRRMLRTDATVDELLAGGTTVPLADLDTDLDGLLTHMLLRGVKEPRALRAADLISGLVNSGGRSHDEDDYLAMQMVYAHAVLGLRAILVNGQASHEFTVGRGWLRHLRGRVDLRQRRYGHV